LLASLLLIASLLFVNIPSSTGVSLLLLASSAVPDISCAVVVPAVDVFLPLLFLPWSPYYGIISAVAAFHISVNVSFACFAESWHPCYCWHPCY
jgi:hypothetical protein